jgi:pimeloyl-ACP methyl ester carboxylesterase
MTHREHIALRTGDFEILSAGPEDGPLVLCLHGFPDFPPSFEPLLTSLAASGYRAVAPWLRGYAPSTLRGPFDTETLAADILALRDALSPSRPYFIVGHDWGAVITYLIAAKYPERLAGAVTMAVPHPGAFFGNIPKDPEQIRRSWYMGLFQLPISLVERLVRRDDFALIERLWSAWSPGYRIPDAHLRALKDCLDRSLPAPVLYYQAYFRPLGEAIRRLRWSFSGAAHIRVPLLTLLGAEDGCVGPKLGDGDERFYSGPYRRDILPNAGHFMQLERPEEVARRVLGWFDPIRRDQAV